MAEVISVGIVIADCVARPVERLPAPGQLELVSEIGLFAGGSALNSAFALIKLGVSAALIGRVGRDGFGDFLAQASEAAGCDTRFLQRDESATSATLVNVDAAGERSFLHAIGANAHLTSADVPLERLAHEGARALHVAGYFVLPGLEPQIPALFERTTHLGLLTSLDNVWDATNRWERLHGCLPHTDIFCPSLHDARRMTGCESPGDVVDALFALGVRRAVALKMGPDGALIGGIDGERLLIEAPRVTAVDGTGAGDAFIGGFLAGLLRGEDLIQAGRLACAAGGLCVTAMGAVSGLQDLAATRALAKTLGVQIL